MNTAPAQLHLQRIRALARHGPMRILNVCGGHERTLAQAGVRSLLPETVDIIPGPGCPVCVCPEEDVHDAIRIAITHPITLVAFGDLLRVPVNVPKSEPRSLLEARAAGADVRPIASPGEAAAIARAQPARNVVFLAAGFETTMAPVAALLADDPPANLFVLLSGRLTWPVVAHLLDTGAAAFDALIAPGHVATIMGTHEWSFVSARHGLPTAVAGFHAESLLAAIAAVLEQRARGEACLANCYRSVARDEGNATARRILDEQFDVVDANWRGIGMIPASGYALGARHVRRDARARFPVLHDADRRRLGEMPPGCDCAQVVLGAIKPNACRLYGRACTPATPIGPCMVSDEGACRIWWSSGVRVPS